MKKMSYIVIFLVMLFISMPTVSALQVNDQGFITKDDVLFYSEPNYGGSQVLNTLDTGDMIKILDSNLVASTDPSKCSSGFYKISFTWETYNRKTYTGYVCSDFMKFEIDTTDYAEEFAAANIPEIYWDKLSLLKSNHPNWKFTGYKTNLKWNDVITAESQVGISYIQDTNPIYLSLDYGSYNPITKTYNQMEAGGWYAANKQTVAFYMDPRNFFNEINIFMFENLGYNSNYQTKDVVKSLFSGTDLEQYTDKFMEAATFEGNNVSPLSLAARSRQEIVISGGKLSDSANGRGMINNKAYYNFYNIGAFSTCSNPILCALDFAKGYDENYTSYGRPWDTADKAILWGAKYIGDGYINEGQNTLYFQRFNVTNKSTYSHQYMTNIMAPRSESTTSYNSYKDMGKLDSTIEFIIPVYNDMPKEAAALPTKVDANRVEQINKDSADNALLNNTGYTFGSGYVSTPMGTIATHMITAVKTAGGSASITTDGKSISGGEVLGTGDIVNVTIDGSTNSYRVVVRGDTSGDGIIDAVDYVKIYKYIMGGTTLNGSYAIAADVNSDGVVDAVDYVKVYKYIMNGGTL